ncbi:RNA methyltransferase [bacterium]|nr:RNA methyltransferase [candidate division CSSED10-310 bacterium]
MKKILTRCSPPETAPDRIDRFPIYAVLENIRSLYNVGAMFRTADAVRVASLHLCGITGRPPRKEIVKTALGAQDTVPWEYFATGAESVRNLKSRGIQVWAVEQTSVSHGIWEAPLRFPVAFVFGYEIEGVDNATLAECDGAIEIPMFGYKGSLNVAAACSIVLYEALRQLSRSTETCIRSMCEKPLETDP